jgi:hypothetical protein
MLEGAVVLAEGGVGGGLSGGGDAGAGGEADAPRDTERAMRDAGTRVPEVMLPAALSAPVRTTVAFTEVPLAWASMGYVIVNAG